MQVRCGNHLELDCACNGSDPNTGRAGFQQHSSAFPHGCARGEYVINEQYFAAPDSFFCEYLEGAAKVGLSLLARHAYLRLCPATAQEHSRLQLKFAIVNLLQLANRVMSHEFRLVKSTIRELGLMKRNGHDQNVVAEFLGQRAGRLRNPLTEQSGRRTHMLILKKVDQFAQSSFVSSEGYGARE